MEHKNFETWCANATGLIRYGPDRRLIHAELMAHMEDAFDARIVAGDSPEEARQKTLHAMGSAEEIAPQLAAIHKPWLGYIHILIRFVAIFMIAVAVFSWVSNGISLAHNLISSQRFEALPANYGKLDYYAKPNVKDTSDGCLFRVSEAGFQREQALFRFQLDIIYMPFHRGGNADTLSCIWAIDSNGNRYASQIEGGYRDIPKVHFGGYSSSALISSHHVTITQFDCSARWVELHYDRDGRDLVLRIELPGGEQP